MREMESRVEGTKSQLARLQNALLGEITSLSCVDDIDDSVRDIMGQSATEEEGNENGSKAYSDAQDVRLERRKELLPTYVTEIYCNSLASNASKKPNTIVLARQPRRRQRIKW